MRKVLFCSVVSMIALMDGSAPVAAQDVVIAPPPPQVEAIPVLPGPGYAWIPGYWTWVGNQWAWAPGHYELAPRPGAIWIVGHWRPLPGGRWRWGPGHWRYR